MTNEDVGRVLTRREVERRRDVSPAPSQEPTAPRTVTPCPAATGIAISGPGCERHDDRAHRCALSVATHRQIADQRPALPVGVSQADHVCQCGFIWIAEVSLADRVDRMNRLSAAARAAQTSITDLGAAIRAVNP